MTWCHLPHCVVHLVREELCQSGGVWEVATQPGLANIRIWMSQRGSSKRPKSIVNLTQASIMGACETCQNIIRGWYVKSTKPLPPCISIPQSVGPSQACQSLSLWERGTDDEAVSTNVLCAKTLVKHISLFLIKDLHHPPIDKKRNKILFMKSIFFTAYRC